ncbi:MAG: dicarboxylate/amino acid:cation symporter, partial [Sphingopyxis sp.]|nr:dicarboxylate/amino acid:cation symporter [Sphingopyxis sp.]
MPRISPLAIFIALIGGLGAGIALAGVAPERVDAITAFVDPVGALWLRALQMTIIPLVVALLITGIVTSVAAARAGKIAGWSIGFFFAVLWGGAIMSAFMTPLLLEMFPIPAAAAETLVGSLASAGEIGEVPAFSEFVKAMIPTNPVAAAANDAILPLIIFTAIFALAITRLEAGPRDLLSNFFSAIGDAMLVVIGWVLALAPIGVAALAFVVAARTGVGAIGVFLHYILIVSLIGVIVWAAAYPLGIIGGRRKPMMFVRAVLPSQAVAISTQSSLASLPAMLRGAKMLGVRETTADVTLPLAVALFRSTGPAMNMAVAIYVASLTGVELTPMTLAIGVAVAATTTLGAVSLPGSISFISSIAPIALAMGVPIEPLALLIAVETMPDIIRTLGHVSNDVAAAATVDARAVKDTGKDDA